MEREYDVFISYNSSDRNQALSLNLLLKHYFGLRTWFDDHQVVPGTSFITAIDNGLSQSLTCLALIGQKGGGPWQKKEIEIALLRQINHPHFRIIPVLLPSAPPECTLPSFLGASRLVDLRTDPLRNLPLIIQGVRGTDGIPLYTRAATAPDDSADLQRLPAGYTADVAKIVQLQSCVSAGSSNGGMFVATESVHWTVLTAATFGAQPVK